MGIEALTLEHILGYLFAPIAFMIGVPWEEVLKAGSFIGQKIVLNEFVAYTAFAPEIANLSQKSVVVISFALCGLGGFAPSRRSDLAEMGLRAVVAATLANLLSAAIAGMLI